MCVLDLTHGYGGAYANLLLHDLGAEIIKVELPDIGASDRKVAPMMENGESAYFLTYNRGKKSIALDFTKPDGKQLLKQLVKKADVVIENYSPGFLSACGFSYETLSAIKPELVMCSLSVFGQKVPSASYEGDPDILAQASSGLCWMTGDADDAPLLTGTSMGSGITAAHAGMLICAALYRRNRTGEGEYIDLAARDVLSAVLETGVVRYTLSEGDDLPIRSGRHHATMGPYGVFEGNNDEYAVIACLNAETWNRLVNAINRPELAGDPMFNSATARATNIEDTKSVIETWLKSFDDITTPLAILEEADVPSSAVMSVNGVVNDPHYKERQLSVNLTASGKSYQLPATPFAHLSLTPCPAKPELAPSLGEHTTDILKQLLGYSKSEIARLQENQIIQ